MSCESDWKDFFFTTDIALGILASLANHIVPAGIRVLHRVVHGVGVQVLTERHIDLAPVGVPGGEPTGT